MNAIGKLLLLTLLIALPVSLPADGAAPAADAASVRFDLIFNGGTVAELVARVHRLLAEKQIETPLNISVLPDQAATAIPPLTLRQVNFRELGEFLRKASRERTRDSVQAGRAAQEFGFEQSGGIWFFVVSTEEGIGRAKVTPVTERAAIYRVKAAADVDVIGVLEDSFKTAGRSCPQRMTYEQGTHSLILRGTDADHEVAVRAVQLLERDASKAQSEVLRLEDEKRALAARCAQLEKDLQDLKSQVKSLQR